MNHCICLFVAAFAALTHTEAATASSPQPASAHVVPRHPVGVLVQVDANSDTKSLSESQLRAYFQRLLADNAVAGIWLGVQWRDVGLSDPDGPPQPAGPYDWSKIDTVFEVVEQLNLGDFFEHPRQVVLSFLPGFYSPKWITESTDPSLAPCDYLICGGSGSSCGRVKFPNYPEKVDGGPIVLPIPWNATYQRKWHEFIAAVRDRYQNRKALVGIQIGGPTGPSPELILPATITGPGDPTYFGECNTSANDMWAKLTSSPATSSPYSTPTDDVLVTAWADEIAFFNRTFRGITLIITPDAGTLMPGLPSSAGSNWLEEAGACSDPSAHPNQMLSCAAVTTIVANYLRDTTGHDNLLATHFGGLVASSPKAFNEGDMAMVGVKLVASRGYLGGAEFDHMITNGTIESYPYPNYQFIFDMGSVTPADCGVLTPECAIFNTMANLFYETPGADTFTINADAQGGLPKSLGISYVTVRAQDIQYAQEAVRQQICTLTPLIASPVSAHYLLELANWRLSMPDMGRAGHSLPKPMRVCH